MTDYTYTLQVGKMQAGLLRQACVNAEHRCRRERDKMEAVPEDLRTAHWSNEIKRMEFKIRQYADLGDALWEILYAKRPEPWEDFVESLP